MFDIGKLVQANSLQEAIGFLQSNPEARLIAGGTDLIIKIREGKLPGAQLVSIHGLPELSRISLADDGIISIGSGVTFTKISRNPLIRGKVPVLAEAVETVGGPQIRHVGTIGGNLCNGVTSADSVSTLLALNASLKIVGPWGSRMLSIHDFYQGPGRVNLAHDEVLTEILLSPEDYQGFGGHYIKYAMRQAMDIATLGCAVVCQVGGKDRVIDVRLAFGVAAPTPIRARKTEEMARGRTFGEELVEEFGQSAVTEVNPRTSWRASREFRLQLVKELSKRAFREAFIRAGGEC